MTSYSLLEMSPARTNRALIALFLGAFVVGSAELIVVGVLNLIAADLAVSIRTAGTLVTAYALGIAIGGPLLTALSIRLSRQRLLWIALSAYVAGNIVEVSAATFGTLLAARVVTGALHGLFIGTAFAVAAGLVAPAQLGRAIAMVLGGIAVATAIGVPLGTWLGQIYGWRVTFLAIVALGIVALVMALLFIPAVAAGGGGAVTAQARHALAPPVLAVLAVGFLLMGGQFAALTYLTPFLERVTGISGGLISLFLLGYGVANAVGTFAGGRAADWSATTTLVAANVLLVGALGALYRFGGSPLPVALALSLWGLVGFGLVPALQYRVVSLAGPGRDLAATLPASAVTAGIAAGALVGGWAVERAGPAAAVLVGLALCAVALPATWLTGRLKAPLSEGGAPEASGAAPAAVSDVTGQG